MPGRQVAPGAREAGGEVDGPASAPVVSGTQKTDGVRHGVRVCASSQGRSGC